MTGLRGFSSHASQRDARQVTTISKERDAHESWTPGWPLTSVCGRAHGEPRGQAARGSKRGRRQLRSKGLIERIPQTQTYRLADQTYRLAVLYLKMYHQLYTPLTAAILEPYVPDNWLPNSRRAKLDRLYAAVDQTLQKLVTYVGIAQPA
jgi:hypothetical protein